MNSVVSLQEWWPWYERIARALGLNIEEDRRAADTLSDLISNRSVHLGVLRNLIFNRPVLVLGAGPSLEEDLRGLVELKLLNRFVVVAADGATTAVLDVTKSIPHIVVTDLDGEIEHLLQASKLGSIMVVHGHGDNIGKMKRYVPYFKNVIGTTQVEPRPNVYNFGGFTDGDRAVFLAVSMGAKLVVLAGMDLGSVVGRYSKEFRSYSVKIRKLRICKELLEWISSKTSIPLYNITKYGERISGFKNISLPELSKSLNLVPS